jgi:hypothetical protein
MENTEITTVSTDGEFALPPLEYEVIGDYPDGDWCVSAVFGLFDMLREFRSKPAGYYRLTPEQHVALQLMGETLEDN